MDLNELLSRHQIALIRANDNGVAEAPCPNAVAHFAGLLSEFRADLGVPTYAEAC